MRIEAKNISPEELSSVVAAGVTVSFFPDDQPQGELPDNRTITPKQEFCLSNSNQRSWIGNTGWTRVGTPEHLSVRRDKRD